jgi:spore coat polysaccharide biosynthesis predicted glycosyltransferase SpsG
MTPRILFVPVSGAGGAGEFMRSLIVARGVRTRWPEAHIHFIVNAQAGYARQLEFSTSVIDGSPTYNIAAVNEIIASERPHIVVFDSSGRVAQYRQARKCGARVVYVSSRFKTRWKGFRWRRMHYFDQHWIAQPRFLGSDLTRWERFKLRFVPRVEPVFLETLFEPPEPERRARLLADLGVEPGRYAVFCIGSGGRYARTSDAAGTLLAAAGRVHAATNLRSIVITGPNASMPSSLPQDIRAITSLPNGELMDLMTAARFAVVNGGSLLLQVIANRVPAVAVPVAGDQADRIARCSSLGLVASAALDVGSIEQAVLKRANDERARAQMKQAMESLDLRNGAVAALEALERLLERVNANST